MVGSCISRALSMPNSRNSTSSNPSSEQLQSLLKQMDVDANGSATGLSPGDIEALGRSLWEWADETALPGPAVRTRPALGENGHDLDRTLLEAVGPDKPFLVDSLLGLCTELGFEVRALFHPIVKTEDGPDISTIQIHLPRLSTEEAGQLAIEARKTLDEVGLAVSDHIAMRERMAQEIERLKNQDHLEDHNRDEATAFLDWLTDEHFVFLGVREYRFETSSDGRLSCLRLSH